MKMVIFFYYCIINLLYEQAYCNGPSLTGHQLLDNLSLVVKRDTYAAVDFNGIRGCWLRDEHLLHTGFSLLRFLHLNSTWRNLD